MDKTSVKKINNIIFNDNISKSLSLPVDYFLNLSTNYNIKNIWIEIDEGIKFFPFQKNDEDSIFQICNKDDLDNILRKLKINSFDIKEFNIKLIETSKWGLKPVFINGTNSNCFSSQLIKSQNRSFIAFYNTSGSKEIESIYIHGIWEIIK